VGLAIDVCQCNVIPTDFIFINNNDAIEHYTVYKEGLASSWNIPISDHTLTIIPSQGEKVVAFVSIPCDAAPGEYDLTLKAIPQRADHETITVTHAYTVSTCHSFDVVTENDSYDICVDSELLVPINISNTGEFEETINIEASHGNLSSDTVILAKGESAVINFSYKTNELKSNLINIKAYNDEFVATKSLNVTSIECSFFEAELLRDNIAMCENEDENITLRITNLDNKTNTIYIDLESDFIGAPDEVVLEPLEERDVDLQVHSTCDTQILTRSISLYTIGSDRKNLFLILNFRGCYQPIVISDIKTSNACACEELSYEFNLYNPGTKEMTYALSPSRGILYDEDGNVTKKVTLSPDESNKLILNLTLDCDELGYVPITLTATGLSVCNK
jgi:hypothetical protein